ncbi:MAG: flavodoxin family protein [Candidatus Bipolaricaulota bacterium]|nr:flavodoxin family protein [Candidatus Bipolaricaulota bacterium]MBS3792659.1 flavodoxin family protein [Candidatus Bipolaricaulota bacterium]
MTTIGVVYHSKTGNTKKMAEKVVEGIEEAEGEATTVLKTAEETDEDELLNWDGIIVGSPTYYGLPSASVKDLFDRSVTHHGELEGKVGGAFTSAANRGGGNETTILALLEMMLIHGMIVQGTSKKDHYGPVALGKPDERALKGSRELGKRVATLCAKLFG